MEIVKLILTAEVFALPDYALVVKAQVSIEGLEIAEIYRADDLRTQLHEELDRRINALLMPMLPSADD